ncbi:Dinucleoside triphosphate hydrolase [Tieghemiomyces parasiticus]|uniref:Dinucleoside triphosphate hydrolase n=1 Tax=Tieghemiomyces parasiticus TaxID=78921 RepID=A0A9W8A476_9FUNG|nr:Dinucleoside triphosphate hydrolase [Tieghemiomyces parasiticus]
MTIAFGPHAIRHSQVFFSSALSYGLVNLKPIARGHVLVIPKRNVPRFTALTPAEVSDLFLSAQTIGRVVETQFQGQALTVAMQDGPAAGQTVPHVHIHVIPRRFGDWANNDDVYAELDQTKVDNEERKPRSEEEMAAEADFLRAFFPPLAAKDGQVSLTT